MIYCPKWNNEHKLGLPFEHPVHRGEHDCVPHQIQHIEVQQVRMEKGTERMSRVHHGQTGKEKERA